MLKFGKITNIDYEAVKAKVQFDDNNIVSKFLPISVNFSLNDSETISLDVNTPVWCMMDENLENGVIGGALYNKKTIPKGAAKNVFSKEFSDGTRIEYNKSSHELKVSGGSLKIIYHGGNLGGLVKAGILKTESEKDKAILDAIMSIVNGSPIPEPGNGLPSALQGALQGALAGKSSGTWTALENDKIKQ